jgi:hypothetical protein
MKIFQLLCSSLLFVFSSISSNGQSWIWGRSGTTWSDTYALAADNNGNAYIAGTFVDSITFGPKHLNEPYQGTYLVKYDTSGNLVWARQSHDASAYSATSTCNIAIDKHADIYEAGIFQDTSSFGTDTVYNLFTNNVYLVKYDSGGNVLWLKQGTQPSKNCNAFTYSVAADTGGNAYVVGQFTDTINFGPHMLKTIKYVYSNFGWGNIFLVKYSSVGNVMWARQANFPSNSSIASNSTVTTDKSGNIYIT